MASRLDLLDGQRVHAVDPYHGGANNSFYVGTARRAQGENMLWIAPENPPGEGVREQRVGLIPRRGGRCVLLEDPVLAIYNLTRRMVGWKHGQLAIRTAGLSWADPNIFPFSVTRSTLQLYQYDEWEGTVLRWSIVRFQRPWITVKRGRVTMEIDVFGRTRREGDGPGSKTFYAHTPDFWRTFFDKLMHNQSRELIERINNASFTHTITPRNIKK